jgi:hypothetical protein
MKRDFFIVMMALGIMADARAPLLAVAATSIFLTFAVYFSSFLNLIWKGHAEPKPS